MACLGEASRFGLVEHLANGPRCVSDLAREVGLSQSCTTRHLQTLARFGIVRGRRDGKRVVFQVCAERPAVHALLGWAMAPEGSSRVERARARANGNRQEASASRPGASASTRVAPPAARSSAASQEVAATGPVGAPIHRADRMPGPDVDVPPGAQPGEDPSPPDRRYAELEDFLL
jgi:DNA-binding transcriptional ArsR family regulator